MEIFETRIRLEKFLQKRLPINSFPREIKILTLKT